jgi:hypothetical protein
MVYFYTWDNIYIIIYIYTVIVYIYMYIYIVYVYKKEIRSNLRFSRSASFCLHFCAWMSSSNCACHELGNDGAQCIDGGLGEMCQATLKPRRNWMKLDEIGDCYMNPY